MNLLSIIFVLTWVNVNSIYGREDADRITNLPNLQFTPNFKSYSGYLQGTTLKFLHYWFVESQGNPSKDPLILWFNGGPGCSSLEGLLREHGPYLLTDMDQLVKNPYSWNMNASVLYLESPAGVGFSVAVDGNTETNDDDTSLNSYMALKSFFRKFPEFAHNDFYITGESYGGVYVPTLSVRVAQDNHINFKGLMIGNGITSYEINDASLLYFEFYHGLVSHKNFNFLMKECCPEDAKFRCFVTRNTSQACVSMQNKLSEKLEGLDIYNLYQQCYGGADMEAPYHRIFNLLNKNPIQNWKQNLYKLSKKKMIIPCINDTALTTYLNRWDVKKAIHIPSSFHDRWTICSLDLQYHKTYESMASQYKILLNSPKKLRIWLYYGDVDMACNFYGGEWFFDDLDLTLKTQRHHWLYTDVDGTQQIGGFAKSWSENVLFTTIRGSGHMVPTDKPRVAYHLISAFLAGREL